MGDKIKLWIKNHKAWIVSFILGFIFGIALFGWAVRQ